MTGGGREGRGGEGGREGGGGSEGEEGSEGGWEGGGGEGQTDIERSVEYRCNIKDYEPADRDIVSSIYNMDHILNSD